MTSNPLDRKYEKIVNDKKKAQNINSGMMGSVFVVLISINIVLSGYKKPDNNFWIALGIFIIFSIALTVLYRKQKDYVVDKKREQFFAFYGAYQALEEYKIDKDDKKAKQKAQDKMKQLSFYVGQWTKWTAPSVFRNELVNSIYSNLWKVVKFVEQGKVDDLSLFIENLHIVSDIISRGNEPSLVDWQGFNNSINSLQIPPEPSVKERVTTSKQRMIAKCVILGVIVGIVLDPVLISQGMKSADALLGSVSVAFVAMGSLAALSLLPQKLSKD